MHNLGIPCSNYCMHSKSETAHQTSESMNDGPIAIVKGADFMAFVPVNTQQSAPPNT